MMHDISVASERILPMGHSAINNVRQLESLVLQCPQTDIPTSHVIHGGMYARTIKIPANTVLTGALIKIATILIVSGDCIVYLDGSPKDIIGYHVMAASSGRKQAFVTRKDTYLTMLFPTQENKLDAIEEQFTDDADILMSREEGSLNDLLITGE